MNIFEEILSDVEAIKTEGRKKALLAGFTLLGEIEERIFEKGLDTNGGAILGGEYSKTPYFALYKNFITKGGIPQNLISTTGKSVRLPEGYTSFRKFSGRQTNFVDLDYTGQLRNAFILQPTEKGFVIGVTGGRGNAETGATPADKIKYLETMNKGPIFFPTNKEVDNFHENIII